MGLEPRSPFRVFWLVPLRELPVVLPTGECFSYPRWSVSSPSSARSTRDLVSCFSSPSLPNRSLGSLTPFNSSSISSSFLVIVFPHFKSREFIIYDNHLHITIYTPLSYVKNIYSAVVNSRDYSKYFTFVLNQISVSITKFKYLITIRIPFCPFANLFTV